MDPDALWHSLGGGAIIAAALTFARLLLDYGSRASDRRRGEQRDAEARLERVLQDRVAEADRRLERCELDLNAERGRRAALEHEHAMLLQAHARLKEQCAWLVAELAAQSTQASQALTTQVSSALRDQSSPR